MRFELIFSLGNNTNLFLLFYSSQTGKILSPSITLFTKGNPLENKKKRKTNPNKISAKFEYPTELIAIMKESSCAFRHVVLVEI
jgi:hypothetical protein